MSRKAESFGGAYKIALFSAVGGAISLLSTPILSIVYQPADLGRHAELLAIVSIWSTIGALRLDQAIPISDESELPAIARLTSITSVIVGCLCAAFVVVTGRAGTTTSEIIEVLLIPAILSLLTMYVIVESLLVRQRNHGALAFRRLVQPMATTLGQLAMSIVTSSSLGLTIGVIAGRSLGFTSLFSVLRNAVTDSVVAQPGFRTVLRKYWRFPIVFAPAAIANAVGSSLPLLLVARWFGSSEAGQLALAITLTTLPPAIISVAFGNIFRGELALRLRSNQHNQQKFFLRASVGLAAIASLWFLVLVLVSRTFVPRVFGPDWATLPQYVEALAVSAASGLAVSPLTSVLGLYQRGLPNLLLDISRIVMVGFVGFIAWRSGASSPSIVLAMSISMAAVYVATWLTVLHISGGRSRI